MKLLIRALSLSLAIIACIFTTLAGVNLCMHTVFKKNNMIKIVDQYMMNTDDAKTDEAQDTYDDGMKSIYEVLDSGSESGINAIISNPDLLNRLKRCGTVSDISKTADSDALELSQIGDGLAGIISGFKTVLKVFKGECGLVSLLLNVADTGDLLSNGLIDKVLSDEKVTEYYTAPENADELKEAFLHTKLASHITLEAMYVYYDYFNSSKNAEDWQQRLCASLTGRMNEREQDLAFLVGHGITEEDRSLTDALKTSLTETVISEMTAPKDKASSISGGTRTVLNLFFADRTVATLFVIALLTVAMIFFICRGTGDGTTYFGLIMIFAGIFLVIIRFMKNHVIGPFYNESNSEFKAMSLFLIAGLVFILIGVLVMITPDIIKKIKYKRITKGTKIDANVPSFAEVNAISQMGLGDLVVKNSSNKNRRADGLVDYYGDGRGLHAQLEYKKRKEEAEKDNSNDGFGYPPDDDGTY